MRTKSAAFISVSLLALLILTVVGLFVYHTGNNEPLKTEVSKQVESTKKEDVALPDETTPPVAVVPGNIKIPDYKHLKSFLSPQELQEYEERDRSMRASLALMQAAEAVRAKQAKYFENRFDYKHLLSLSPQAFAEYLRRDDVRELRKSQLESGKELLREMQAYLAMANKHIEDLKAQGKFVPVLEPHPIHKRVDQIIADSRAKTAERNREIEALKKRVSEMNAIIDPLEDSLVNRNRSARVETGFDPIENPKPTTTSPSDTKPTPTNTGAWQNDLDTYMTTLDADIVNKYPLATFAQSLPKEELDTLFNADAKTFLQSQQKQMVADITQKINQYLLDNGENRTDKIGFIRERLSQYWDADIVEQISTQLK